MKERPILFNGDMVRALLDGRKTQSRQLVTPYSMTIASSDVLGWDPDEQRGYIDDDSGRDYFHCPYGQLGDRLWVKECISEPYHLDLKRRVFTGFYRATDPDRAVKWRPSKYMPRWASRIILEIESIRIERLHDISEADAMAEGVEADPNHTTNPLGAYYKFRYLWESINGPGSWDKNPWVWVVSFRRINP